MTGDKLRRQEPDGSMVTLAEQACNEIVADGHGNVYINGADFNFPGGEAPKPGYIKLLTPDGELRQVADDIQFPNGMVITPNNRTLIIAESFARRLTAFDIDADGGLSNRRGFAEGLGPDGICLDAEGAVWVGTPEYSIVRVAEGGEVLQRVEIRENRAPFALMLGGPDRRTLFIMTVEWRPADGTANLERLANGPRTGEILTLLTAATWRRVDTAALKLKRQGRAIVGRCIFHPDGGRPNLHVYGDPSRGGAPAVESAETFWRSSCTPRTSASVRPSNCTTNVPPSFAARHVTPQRLAEPRASWRRRTVEELAVLQAATSFYHSNLLAEPQALDYLAQRGISLATTRQCRLGYAAGDRLLALAKTSKSTTSGLLRISRRRDGLQSLNGSSVCLPAGARP